MNATQPDNDELLDSALDEWVAQHGIYSTFAIGPTRYRVGTDWRAVARRAYRHGITKAGLDTITRITEEEDVHLRAVSSLARILHRMKGVFQADEFDDVYEALGEGRRFGTDPKEGPR